MERFNSCLSTIVTSDYNYAQCVMNSGFFELSSPSAAAISTSPISFLSRSRTSTAVDSIGTCSLTCTKPTFRASSSCCSAATTLRNCHYSSSSISYCKSVIEDYVANSQQCGLSAEDTALIVCVVVIAAFFLTVIATATIYAKKQVSQAADEDGLESRFSLAKKATWGAILATWRQVTNLV